MVYQLQTTAAAATTNGDPGFAFSSLLTPFFMGTVIGAIATGQIPADASHADGQLSGRPGLVGFGFLATGPKIADKSGDARWVDSEMNSPRDGEEFT